MRMIKYIAIFFAFMSGLVACEDEFSPNIPQGRIEEVSFAKDTFVFSEAAGNVEIPINAVKYMNYAANITVKVTEESAIEKEHFYIDEKEVKMLLGEAVVNIEMRTVNDTVINESRTFRLTLESIKGGGKPAATRQTCVVVLRNDDYIPEAATVFDNLTAKVKEDDKTLTIPFHVTKPVPGAVTVTFAQGKDDRQTAQEGIHFNFFGNVKSVTLPEGTLSGEIKLEIINNQTADGEVNFDLVMREAEGALIGLDSVCNVIIEDDDLARTVSIGGEGVSLWREEAGTIEVPLIFEGGHSEERMITGKITIDSLFGGCTSEDFTLETTEFSTAGDETQKIRIKLKDNETFGEWGFRINLRELKNVNAASPTYVLQVKDDERILGFNQDAYEVEEGKQVSIYTLLKGGPASQDIPVSVEVVANGTTALPEQYTLPATFNKLIEGSSSSNFILKTSRHATREDRVLKLRVTTTAGAASPGKILQDETFECSVTIKNTDKSVGFLESQYVWLAGGAHSIPLITSGFDENVLVYVKIKSSTLDARLLSNFITIKAGEKNGSIGLETSETMTPDDRIVLEIEKLMFDSGEDNSQINPIKATAVCRVLGTEQIDRTGWTISSFSSEEAEGEGETGRAADILDGDLGTFWHSKWQGGQDPSPFVIIVDMQNTVAANGGDIIRRKGNGNTKKVVMEMSDDQKTWTPVGTVDTFTGDNGSVKNTTDVVFGRYLRLTINDGTAGVASIAEVYLTGDYLNEQ